MAPQDLFADDEPPTKRATGKTKASKATEFTINPDFAERYEQKKRGEELSKLKDKYGSDYEDASEDSEEFSSEDSEAEFVTPAVDAAILRTISRIRRADPTLYNGGQIFQDEEHLHHGEGTSANRKVKSNPVFLRDFQRKALMATRGGEKEDTGPSLTPAKEAELLQQETRRAFMDSDDDSGDDLLVPRGKERDEAEVQEEEYEAFLRSHVGDADIETALKRTAEQSADTDDTFLRNFVLGRGWLDKKSKTLPKYAEVILDRGAAQTGSNAYNLDPTLDDEDLLHEERADAFESKYNFRFEDQDGARLVTHSRDVGTSVRRKDESRKQAREATKSRKAEEKRAKLAELDRLKDLKKGEIVAKIAQIRKNAGDLEFALDGMDFESDFDPDEHDRRMVRAFDEEYYGREDADGKPIFDDDIDVDDIVEDLDAAFEPGGEAYDPLAPNTRSSKRQKQRDKKKSKKRQLVDDALGGSDAEAGLTQEQRKSSLGKALEEYKTLEAEDLVGDLPTKFKYTKVDADAFDLTPAEILMATDAELNEVLGLRKIAPYRALRSKRTSVKKKKLQDFREKLAGRKWGDDVEAEGVAHVTKAQRKTGPVEPGAAPRKRKGKKERQKEKAHEVGGHAL